MSLIYGSFSADYKPLRVKLAVGGKEQRYAASVECRMRQAWIFGEKVNPLDYGAASTSIASPELITPPERI